MCKQSKLAGICIDLTCIRGIVSERAQHHARIREADRHLYLYLMSKALQP
jgi:hypothetical protein